MKRSEVCERKRNVTRHSWEKVLFDTLTHQDEGGDCESHCRQVETCAIFERNLSRSACPKKYPIHYA